MDCINSWVRNQETYASAAWHVSRSGPAAFCKFFGNIQYVVSIVGSWVALGSVCF